jgi:uncharacterized protein (TIGR03437 family)
MKGAKVLIAGIEAPLYYVSDGLIDIQVPNEVPLGTVSVVVSLNGVESTPVNVQIAETSPGVFGYPRTATDYDPVIVHLDAQLVTPSNPAKAGEFLLVFLTGVGELMGSPQTGNVAQLNPLPAALAPTTVTLGGAPVQTLFMGHTPGFIGLGQLNIKLPDTLPAGNKLPLRIRVGNGTAPDVFLAVQ